MRKLIFRLFIVVAFLFFQQNFFASTPTNCNPTIKISPLPGNYIPSLTGNKNTLEDFLKKLGEENPDYCDANYDVVFTKGFSTKQMIARGNVEEKEPLYLELQYYTPSYKVLIKNKSREILQELEFGGDLKSKKYPSISDVSSYDELYQRWTPNKRQEYRGLEQEGNNFKELMDFLSIEIQSNKTIMEKETPPSPVVKNQTIPSSKPVTEKQTVQKKQTNKKITGNVKSKSVPTPSNTPSSKEPTVVTTAPKHVVPKNNNTSTKSSKPVKYELADEPFIDMVSFNFCNQYSYYVYNRAKFPCIVSIGHEGEAAYESFTIGRKSKVLKNRLKEGDWYTITYSEEIHENEMKWRLQRIDKLVDDLGKTDMSVMFGKIFLDMMPDQVVTTKYDPFGHEVSTNIDDNTFEKEFGKAFLDIANSARKERVKMDVKKILADIELSKNIFKHYEVFINNAPPKHQMDELPDFLPHSKKRMSPNFSLSYSISTINFDKEEGFHEFWTPNSNHKLAFQVGIPHEKVSGIQNLSFFRTYLMFGYEITRFELNEGNNYYVGPNYVKDGESALQYKLVDPKNITVRNENIQIGLLAKSMSQGRMFTLGGGVQRRMRSHLLFKKDRDYFTDVSTELTDRSQPNVLKEGVISPFFLAQYGFFFTGKKCKKKLNGFSIMLEMLYSKVEFEQGTNYQLYNSEFDINTTIPPTVDFMFSKKWYFQFGLNIGYHF